MAVRNRTLVVAITATIVALATAAVALGTTHVYWGYNTMNNTNPASGTCSSARSGIACDGFNNWDQNEIAQNSGGNIVQGFQNSVGGSIYGIVRGCCAPDPSPWELAWNDSRLGGLVNHYNRTACTYDFGSGTSGSYVQCRSLIFP